ncbi:hypothetical protein D1007_12429 [Hordeum vulgare]|nr:hypothetical protein D1007_12429 [Hordeum vulgare]
MQFSPREIQASDGVFPKQWCMQPPATAPLRSKKGIIFLKRDLFDGAVLPADTKLGHATATSAVSSTNHAPPPFDYGSLRDILAY